MIKGIAITILLTFCSVHSQTWTYPGCSDVTNNDFRFTTLLRNGQSPDPSLLEPIRMEFDLDDQGNVDIYFVERRGKLKVYRGASNSVTTLGTWDVPWSEALGGTKENAEEGLVGLALDPDFDNNQWIYIMYSPRSAVTHRVSRVTLNGNSVQNEVVLLDIPVQRDICCHTGGAMAFDAYGDLWITVGNNEGRGGGINENEKNRSGEWGASSTASLRGAILRIHPEDDGSYTIPEGNFWEHYADYFDDQGNTSLAAQYRDSTLVKQELYVKGNRNPYSISLDPVRRWLGYGDVGPDGSAPSGNGNGEEFNLHKEPAFAGWPYFAGENHRNAGSKDPNKPMNTSRWNTGVQELPPAVGPLNAFGNSSASSGPIYRYDGNLQSSVKIPPHFDRKWFVTNWSNGQMHVISMDDNGNFLSKQRIFQNHGFNGPLDLKLGPDGALYVINYSGFFNANGNTRIEKIEYTGNCSPVAPIPETAGCMDSAYLEFDANADYSNPRACLTPVPIVQRGRSMSFHKKIFLHLGRGLIIQIPPLTYGLELYDMKGKIIWSASNISEEKWIKLPRDFSGIHFVNFLR